MWYIMSGDVKPFLQPGDESHLIVVYVVNV